MNQNEATGFEPRSKLDTITLARALKREGVRRFATRSRLGHYLEKELERRADEAAKAVGITRSTTRVRFV